MKDLSCWIVHNNSAASPKSLEIIEWLERETLKRNIKTKVLRNNELFTVIDNGDMCIRSKETGDKPHFVIFWDKDIRLAKSMEKTGMKLFNSARAIEICDDKTMTHEILANNSIKMPKTIFSPLVFTGYKENGEEYIEFLEDKLSYPMVVKEAFGSFGAQVYLVKNREELKQKRLELAHKPHLYQEFIKCSSGRDVRLQVVGDEVVAGMFRKSETDFRANITNGGSMFKFEPPNEFKEMAVKCAKLVGVDFAGVDLLFAGDNEPILCEVNSNAHFVNLYHCTGINAASNIVEHIVKKISK